MKIIIDEVANNSFLNSVIGNVLFVRERGRREIKLFLDRRIIKIICIHRRRCAIRHLVWNVIRFRCCKRSFSEWYPEERVAGILKLASQGNSKLTLFHEFFSSGQNRKPQSEDRYTFSETTSLLTFQVNSYEMGFLIQQSFRMSANYISITYIDIQ